MKLFALKTLIIFMVCFCSVAWGAELHGVLGLREEYDDNILLRSDKRLKDYKTIFMPQLSFAYEGGENTLGMQYSSTQTYHNKYDQQDTFSHSLNLTGQTDTERKLSANLTVNDNYRFFLRDPRQMGQPVLVDNLAEGNSLSVTPSLRFQAGSTGRLVLGYQYTNTFYKNYIQGRDGEGHRENVSWEQELGDNVTLELGYSHFNWQFNKPLSEQFAGASRYEDQQGNAGLRWQLTPDISFVGNYSRVWREYNNARKLDFSTGGAKLSAKFFDSSLVQAGYSEMFSDDVSGRTYKNQQASLDLSQEIGSRLVVMLGVSSTKMSYKQINRTTKTVAKNAGLKAELSSKIFLNLNASYQDWTSDPGDITRKVSTLGATMTYQAADWLSFDAGYTHLDSKAGVSFNDYDVNRYSIAVRAVF